jgi:hypothetical protein
MVKTDKALNCWMIQCFLRTLDQSGWSFKQYVPSLQPHGFPGPHLSPAPPPWSSVGLMALRMSILCRRGGPQVRQALCNDFNSAVGCNSICQESFAVSHLIVEGLAHETVFPVYLERGAALEIRHALWKLRVSLCRTNPSESLLNPTYFNIWGLKKNKWKRKNYCIFIMNLSDFMATDPNQH